MSPRAMPRAPRPPKAASRPPSSSTPTSSRRPASPCRSARPDRIEVTACTQAPYMDLEETARVLGVDAIARAHPPDGLRRRLRRQARRVGAAAAGGGGVGDEAAGAHRLHAHRVRWPPPPSAIRPRSGPRPRPTRTAASPPSRCRPISTPAPTPPGDRRWPTACRCTARDPTRCRTCGTARAPSTPTTRRPAPSAASACRRRRSPTRR